jgi:hypothetical protein
MGWEERRGRPYYYRSVREGKRVRKEYVGGGALGQLLAQLDELGRLQRKEEETLCKEERERLERSAGFLRELEEAAEILTRAQLLVAGFHKRKGEWRRLRERSRTIKGYEGPARKA